VATPVGRAGRLLAGAALSSTSASVLRTYPDLPVAGVSQPEFVPVSPSTPAPPRSAPPPSAVGAGAPGLRVRFSSGVAEIPAGAPAVLLPDDAILRWRATAEPPPGPRVPLGTLAPGDPVAVGLGVGPDLSWDQGVVVGRIVRPADAERWIVDGDLRDYSSPEDAEREHGALARGEPAPAPESSSPPADDIPLGDPLTRDELAAALGCDPAEVEACAAALPRATYQRLVSRAFAARPNPGFAPPDRTRG